MRKAFSAVAWGATGSLLASSLMFLTELVPSSYPHALFVKIGICVAMTVLMGFVGYATGKPSKALGAQPSGDVSIFSRNKGLFVSNRAHDVTIGLEKFRDNK